MKMQTSPHGFLQQCCPASAPHQQIAFIYNFALISACSTFFFFFLNHTLVKAFKGGQEPAHCGIKAGTEPPVQILVFSIYCSPSERS